MTRQLETWTRPHYDPTAPGEAFLFYVAFGQLSQDVPLSRSRYRSAGIPEGIDVRALEKPRDATYIDGFFKGPFWDALLAEDPKLATAIAQVPHCVVVQGSIKNPSSLDYFRDVIGLLSYFLDNGAIAIHDLQTLRWYSPEKWRTQVFEPAAPVPRNHVSIFYSQEENRPGLTWFHTRGMRKFGRPDLSIHGVSPRYREAAIDLCNRFIEFQAFGGWIPDGKEIRMGSLPPGGVAHHGGHLEDFDFNNVHVEIRWPDDAQSTK